MAKKKNLTVEDLIAIKAGRKETTMINIEKLGGEIEARRLPMKEVLSMMSDVDENDLASQMNFSCELIYKSCRIFRDEELHKAYSVKKPADIVMAIFEDDMDVLAQIVDQLMKEFYGVVSGNELETFREE